MNRHQISYYTLAPDFSKLLNQVHSCPSCGSIVSFNDLIEIRGYVGCTICLR